MPDRAALVAGARELQARGIARVVVSAGGEGALFALPDAMLWASPPEVALTTTVGAGDAMARLATGCAAAAVSRDVRAAGGGLPLRAETERLAGATRVERL